MFAFINVGLKLHPLLSLSLAFLEKAVLPCLQNLFSLNETWKICSVCISDLSCATVTPLITGVTQGVGGVLRLELLKLKQFVPLRCCIQQLKHCKLKLLMQIHLSSLGKLLCRGLGKCLCTAGVFHVLAQV